MSLDVHWTKVHFTEKNIFITNSTCDIDTAVPSALGLK